LVPFDTPPRVALIVDVPELSALAKPAEFMVAIAGVLDVQTTVAAMFCMLPSLYVPVAENCCVVPATIEVFVGAIAIDCNVAAVTVSTVEPLIDDDAAVIVEVPTPAPLASPEALIVVIEVVPELHVTVLVRF
jgi:hypothetical protein